MSRQVSRGYAGEDQADEHDFQTLATNSKLFKTLQKQGSSLRRHLAILMQSDAPDSGPTAGRTGIQSQ